jgi:predicted  nucleic acid-binding Zn-ribbon protein
MYSPEKIQSLMSDYERMKKHISGMEDEMEKLKSKRDSTNYTPYKDKYISELSKLTGALESLRKTQNEFITQHHLVVKTIHFAEEYTAPYQPC